MKTLSSHGIGLVGFDGDDTLWRSEDYYRAAEQQFEQILGHYLDLGDAGTLGHLLAVERRNLAVFGYGVKGMTLSMIEAAIELTTHASVPAICSRCWRSAAPRCSTRSS